MSGEYFTTYNKTHGQQGSTTKQSMDASGVKLPPLNCVRYPDGFPAPKVTSPKKE